MSVTFTDSERFELLARLFFGKFGVMAPGKDDPTSDEAEDKKRRELWASWDPRPELIDALLYTEAECDDLADTIRRMERGDE